MHSKGRKSGFTLVEVVVFMGLTLGVLGGMIPLILQAKRMDARAEERTAACYSARSVLEELRAMPFDELISTESGFKERKNGTYRRVRRNFCFHTKDTVNKGTTRLKAKETITLVPGMTGGASNFYATVTLQWDSYSLPGQDPTVEQTVSQIIYPKW